MSTPAASGSSDNQMPEETYTFSPETVKLIESIRDIGYSNKQIFLRALILNSNEVSNCEFMFNSQQFLHEFVYVCMFVCSNVEIFFSLNIFFFFVCV